MNWIEFDLLQSHSSGVGLFILGRSCHKSQEFNTNPADGLHTQQPITVQYCRLHIPTCKFRKLCGPQGHWWTNSSLFQIYFVGECTLTHKLPMLLPFRNDLVDFSDSSLNKPCFLVPCKPLHTPLPGIFLLQIEVCLSWCSHVKMRVSCCFSPLAFCTVFHCSTESPVILF